MKQPIRRLQSSHDPAPPESSRATSIIPPKQREETGLGDCHDMPFKDKDSNPVLACSA